MRIISGKWKSRKLASKLPSGIRPTQDAMRETIFNILSNYIEFNDCNCADICAGAGMLGLEVLSRGAKKVYFVDKSRKSIEHIKNNLKLLQADSDSYKIYQLDATQFIHHYKEISPNEQVDIIFTDPPYNTLIADDVLRLTTEYSLLREGGILVAETAIFTQLLNINDYEVLTERQFGASKVTIMKK